MNPTRIIGYFQIVKTTLRTCLKLASPSCFRLKSERPPLQKSDILAGGKPYPKKVREQPQSTEEIKELRLERKYSSKRTINRWRKRQETLGHVLAYKRTGNAERGLKSDDLVNLAFFRAIKLKAQIYE